MDQKPIFYVARPDQKPGGPYSLVQMADLLGKNVITPGTLVHTESEKDWELLSLHPQFNVINSMCSQKATTPFDAPDQPPVPLLSADTFGKLATGAILCFLLGALSYVVTAEYPLASIPLIFAGAGVSGICHCLIVRRLCGDDYQFQKQLRSLPLFDVFYYLDDFWGHFSLLAAKYGSISVVLGAGIALSMHPHP